MQDGISTLTISIPWSLKKKIQALAAAQQRPVSNFLRVLLQEILEKKK
jgi:hypothetical protein